MPHLTTIDVRFSELDPYGHVNHAVYPTYLEVGRTGALNACGVAIDRLLADGIQLVVTRLEIDYRGAATMGDRLTVRTGLEELGRVRGRWRQEIRRDGDLLIRAAVTAAVTDSRGRPTRPPAWLFASLHPLLDWKT
ncbi:MAG: acyl-CoA thioesterase [Acidimicrobiales bacterium]